jgi:hypothetical protein
MRGKQSLKWAVALVVTLTAVLVAVRLAEDDGGEDVLGQVVFTVTLNMTALEDGGEWTPELEEAAFYPPDDVVGRFVAPYDVSDDYVSVALSAVLAPEGEVEGTLYAIGGRYYDPVAGEPSRIVLKVGPIGITSMESYVRFEVTVGDLEDHRTWVAETRLTLAVGEDGTADPSVEGPIVWDEVV